MHYIELNTSELDGVLNDRIGLCVGVDLDERGYDCQEAIGGKYVLKQLRRVDVDGETRAQYVEIVTVQNERAVDDIQKERNVPSGHCLAVHRGEQRPDEVAPRVLVEHVRGEQLAVRQLRVQIEVGLEWLARKHGQLDELLVQEARARVHLAERRAVDHLAKEKHLAVLEHFQVERLVVSSKLVFIFILGNFNSSLSKQNILHIFNILTFRLEINRSNFRHFRHFTEYTYLFRVYFYLKLNWS